MIIRVYRGRRNRESGNGFVCLKVEWGKKGGIVYKCMSKLKGVENRRGLRCGRRNQ